MRPLIQRTDPVSLVGEGDLLSSVALCLLNAGHYVDVYTREASCFEELLNEHIEAQKKYTEKQSDKKRIKVHSHLGALSENKLVIAITPENFEIKRDLLTEIEHFISSETIVAINTETYDLSSLSEQLKNPNRLLGLNWTEPAHTTFFSEIIIAEGFQNLGDEILSLAKMWGKDPYVVQQAGIRSRLLSAMAREACYLVENGYASVQDIDRACRNDAGYYLPFSGNCRYMDLMGTYSYGMVMKDLNPELSKDIRLPGFLNKIVEENSFGMKSRHGFYKYTDAEVEEWNQTMEKFSYQIKAIIEKYPFNYRTTLSAKV